MYPEDYIGLMAPPHKRSVDRVVITAGGGSERVHLLGDGDLEEGSRSYGLTQRTTLKL